MFREVRQADRPLIALAEIDPHFEEAGARLDGLESRKARHRLQGLREEVERSLTPQPFGRTLHLPDRVVTGL